VFFNYFVSFWKHKKYDLSEKNASTKKKQQTNKNKKKTKDIPEHGTKKMYRRPHVPIQFFSFWKNIVQSLTCVILVELNN